MSASSWACQVALKKALQSTALCGGRVYDSVDTLQSLVFPYIEIGDGHTIPDDTTSEIEPGSDSGVSEFVDLHVWGRAHAGKKEVKQIIDGIQDRLHGVQLGVEGRVSALTWVRTIRVITDQDGISAHGIVSIEVVHRS